MKSEKGERITGMINHALLANATGDNKTAINILDVVVGNKSRKDLIEDALLANATGDRQSSIRMLNALVGEDL